MTLFKALGMRSAKGFAFYGGASITSRTPDRWSDGWLRTSWSWALSRMGSSVLGATWRGWRRRTGCGCSCRIRWSVCWKRCGSSCPV